MKVTVQNIVEAIRLGGYTQGRFHAIKWIGDKEFEGDIEDACAVGTAALNLGVDPYHLEAEMKNIMLRKNSSTSMYIFIVEQNDGKKLSLKDISVSIQVKFKAHLNTILEVPERDYSKVTNYQGKKI
jgi:hypothetical protein